MQSENQGNSIRKGKGKWTLVITHALALYNFFSTELKIFLDVINFIRKYCPLSVMFLVDIVVFRMQVGCSVRSAVT